jgi:hypothetical protein
MDDEGSGVQRRRMPPGHGCGDDKAIDIRGFQPRNILRTGYGCLLYHVEQMSLPDAELACSSADDYGVLFLSHTNISFYLLLTYIFVGISDWCYRQNNRHPATACFPYLSYQKKQSIAKYGIIINIGYFI